MARNAPLDEWMVLADFNRSPARMRPALQQHIVAADLVSSRCVPRHRRGAVATAVAAADTLWARPPRADPRQPG
jgi:hypothetical protein